DSDLTFYLYRKDKKNISIYQYYITLGELPARGSQVKKRIPNFNVLAHSFPVILLTDLDNEPCAPIGKNNLLGSLVQEPEFVINIAIDEVEAWLMADKDGFARYFGIPIDKMPNSVMQKMTGFKELPEISVPVKSSWLFTHDLMQYSTNVEKKAQVAVSPKDKNCKGKEYNSAVVPFIQDVWNPEVARVASDSLNRMIGRLGKL
ncbi:MAG: hypothetical protein ACI4TJ_04745, partial [Candidatus Cryptobacteroides sp.]